MTLLLGFGAVNTGNNLLYLMVSALLGFMAVSGVFGYWNLQRLSVALVAPDEVYDGLETLFQVQVTNQRRWLPSFLLDFVTTSAPMICGHLPLLERGGRAMVNVAACLNGRGDHHQHSVTVRSTFPINFFIRSRTVSLEQRITVFPRPISCQANSTDLALTTQGEQVTRHKGQDGDLNRIGDYTGGEPLRMIHWKLSARHDSLKIKELSAVSQPPVELNPLTLPGKNLEQQLRCASYLIREYLRQNRAIALNIHGVVIPAGLGHQHKIRLLTALAHYDQN